MPEPQAYLNGAWLPAAQASISLTDAGFVQGATVSEQLRTFAGTLFRASAHLDRLFASLKIAGIDCSLSAGELQEVAEELVARNHPLLSAGDDLGLAVLITPGAYGSFDGPGGPTVCLHTYPLPFSRWAARYQTGVELLVSSVQMVPPTCWPPELKCRSRMHYYLAQQEVEQRSAGAVPLLLSAEGNVRETPTANVVMVHGNQIVSPPRSSILPGISLAVVEELAASLGLAFVERDFDAAALAQADEVWLTSTPWCSLPVTRFDDQAIGNGEPGSTYARLMNGWNELTGIDVMAQALR